MAESSEGTWFFPPHFDGVDDYLDFWMHAPIPDGVLSHLVCEYLNVREQVITEAMETSAAAQEALWKKANPLPPYEPPETPIFIKGYGHLDKQGYDEWYSGVRVARNEACQKVALQARSQARAETEPTLPRCIPTLAARDIARAGMMVHYLSEIPEQGHATVLGAQLRSGQVEELYREYHLDRLMDPLKQVPTAREAEVLQRQLEALHTEALELRKLLGSIDHQTKLMSQQLQESAWTLQDSVERGTGTQPGLIRGTTRDLTRARIRREWQ